jgi:hypothetical protein
MFIRFYKLRTLAYCSMLSILVHLLLIASMRMWGSYDFSAPVNQPPSVMVDLAAPAAAEVPASVPAPEPEAVRAPAKDNPPQEQKIVEHSGSANDLPPPRTEVHAAPPHAPVAAVAASATASAAASAADDDDEDRARFLVPRRHKTAASIIRPEVLPAKKVWVARAKRRQPATRETPTMLKTVSTALAARYEKLSYLISLRGLPIGNAELESKNENGTTTITLRVQSNALTSSFFHVDNVIETRHIDGRFIMGTIKQQEGDFKSDESFNINLAQQSVTWSDFINHRTLETVLPSDDVLDTLSGIYFLRERPLQLEKTETLHIFDSETFAEVPVEILRREEIRLPNLKKVATIVVRPVQKTAGILRRTGDVFVWMTDDNFKVPVKIVTTISLGEVTAELISAESKPYPVESKDRRLPN